jgi:nicotinic acid mononucleotide adenylyltransferase
LYVTSSWVSNSIAKFNRSNTKLIFIIKQPINRISQTLIKSSINTMKNLQAMQVIYLNEKDE